MNNRHREVVLLASPSLETLRAWAFGLGHRATTAQASSLASLKHALQALSPAVLLLDLDGFDGDRSSGIRELLAINPSVRIIAFSGDSSDASELALFRAGVCGCCPTDIAPMQLQRVVTAVIQGELWIRRTMTMQLLVKPPAAGLELPAARRAGDARLGELTLRQMEIAELVGRGLCNKRIAQHLEIAESTVKTHLTDIFRKLGTSDRLQLALLMNRDLSET